MYSNSKDKTAGTETPKDGKKETGGDGAPPASALKSKLSKERHSRVKFSGSPDADVEMGVNDPVTQARIDKEEADLLRARKKYGYCSLVNHY